MENEKTFGEYLREKRLEKGVNLRKLAADIEIAPAYLSDIENDHRYPPEKDLLYRIAEALHFDEDEKNMLFDLAGGNKKNIVAPDISDYIMQQDKSRVALRMARDTNAGEKEWEKVIRLLEEEARKKFGKKK